MVVAEGSGGCGDVLGSGEGVGGLSGDRFARLVAAGRDKDREFK